MEYPSGSVWGFQIYIRVFRTVHNFMFIIIYYSLLKVRAWECVFSTQRTYGRKLNQLIYKAIRKIQWVPRLVGWNVIWHASFNSRPVFLSIYLLQEVDRTSVCTLDMKDSLLYSKEIPKSVSSLCGALNKEHTNKLPRWWGGGNSTMFCTQGGSVPRWNPWHFNFVYPFKRKGTLWSPRGTEWLWDLLWVYEGCSSYLVCEYLFSLHAGGWLVEN